MINVRVERLICFACSRIDGRLADVVWYGLIVPSINEETDLLEGVIVFQIIAMTCRWEKQALDWASPKVEQDENRGARKKD